MRSHEGTGLGLGGNPPQTTPPGVTADEGVRTAITVAFQWFLGPNEAIRTLSLVRGHCVGGFGRASRVRGRYSESVPFPVGGDSPNGNPLSHLRSRGCGA